MSFNLGKCKIMHVGINKLGYDYYMRGTKLGTTQEERDIGVVRYHSEGSMKLNACILFLAHRVYLKPKHILLLVAFTQLSYTCT